MMIIEEGSNYYYVRHSATYGNITVLLNGFTYKGSYNYNLKIALHGEVASKIGIFLLEISKSYPSTAVKGLILKTEAELAVYGTFMGFCNYSFYY